jgi:selenocysteine lyase/cysteine desulfurase
VPIDLSASGVDFACCGTYKWLMAEYGVAFLYVRPDRIERLQRAQVGWRQLKYFESQVLPLDTPGPAIGPYELRDGAIGLFEVATPAWQALAVAAASIEQIATFGPEPIMRRRMPLIAQLREALQGRGFTPLAPADCPGPIASFAVADAARRFREPLAKAGITVSLRDHWLRVSPSVYNSAEHISRLTGVLTAY